MFLRNWWYVAGWSHQVPVGEIVARTILGEPIVLYRTSAGAVTALEDRCCHRFAPLSRGRLEGDDIRCMYHGMKFSAAGQCVEIPAQAQIPSGAKVRTYPVVEKDRWIWVWMGDAALADATLIPDALNHDDPDFMIGTGQMDYEANYRLIHDNLLDLTHLSFVHEKTLGRRTSSWGTAMPNVAAVEHGVRVSRWLRNGGTPPYVDAPQQTQDYWASFDFVLPGLFLLNTSAYPAGTADKFPDGPSGLDPIWVVVTSQAITPITERSTVYYFSGGQLRRHADPARIDMQLAGFNTAFLEDKSMIEAQQQVVDRSPGRSMMTLQFDRSVAAFRRLLDRMIRDEQAVARPTAAE